MVDTCINTDGTPTVLRIETTMEESKIKIPPFVKILKEVTDDVNYASRVMARTNYKMPQADKEKMKAAIQGGPV